MYNIDDCKVIGITGSVGKSSTSYLVHEYLKFIGKKSVLYSSISIDSPKGLATPNTTLEGAIDAETEIANIINEAEANESDYIVLEVGEETIRSGAVANVPFKIRCLTELWNSWNPHIGQTAYVNLKKSFFENIPEEDECICLFNARSQSFLEQWNACNTTKVCYDTGERGMINYTQRYENIPAKYYPTIKLGGIDHSYMALNLPSGGFEIDTTLATNVSLSNILSAICVLAELGEFDRASFTSFISQPNLEIPGRMQDFQWNGRTFIVDYGRSQGVYEIKNIKNGILDNAKAKYLENKNTAFITQTVGAIKVVCGEFGNVTKHWNGWIRSFANYNLDRNYTSLANRLNQYADYVYLTVDNPCDIPPIELVNGVAANLTIPYEPFIDRKQAIKKAVYDSVPGDVIMITGRGNRKMFYKDYEEIEIFSDIEVLLNAIEEVENEQTNC